MTGDDDRIIIAADDLEVPVAEPPSDGDDGGNRLVVDPVEPPPEEPPRRTVLWAVHALWGRAALGAATALAIATAGCAALGVVVAVIGADSGGFLDGLRLGLLNVVGSSGATTRSQVSVGSGSPRFWVESVSGTAVVLLAFGAWAGNRLGGRGQDLTARLLILFKVALLCTACLTTAAWALPGGPGGDAVGVSVLAVAVGALAVTALGGGVAVLLHPATASSDAGGLRRDWLSPLLTGVRTYALLLALAWVVVLAAGAWQTQAAASLWAVGMVFGPNLAGLGVAVASGATVVGHGSPFDGPTDLRLGAFPVATDHVDPANPLLWLLLGVPILVLTLGANRALRRAHPPDARETISVACRFALGATVTAAAVLSLADVATGSDAPGGVTEVVDLDLAVPLAISLAIAGILIATCIALLWHLWRGLPEAPDAPLTVLFDGP